MFSKFGATAESLSKASSLVLRLGTDAHLYDDPDDVNIGTLLESRFDTEKCEALKRLLALIAQGADVSNFFPKVVKNVASQSLEVKKLVYLYLLHYAEKRQNEALLSINCFQKDLSDTNPIVRAWALRAMAGIHLHVVAPLVLVAVSKCSRDPSAYVRKCAAHALLKLHDLHQEENNNALEELVDILLGDHSSSVVGAAAAAFKYVCPSNLVLIAKNFRRLCQILPDIEEWGQIALIEILLRYVVARHGLVKESIMFNSGSSLVPQPGNNIGSEVSFSNNQGSSVVDNVGELNMNMLMYKCYIEGQQEYFSGSTTTNRDDDRLDCSPSTSSTNDDVKILLQCTSPLLWSQNSAVVLAAASVHWIMAPKDQIRRIIKPILFILRSSRDSQYIMLCNILVFAKASPLEFAPYFEDFFVCRSDPYQSRALKLEILSIIATDSTITSILEEFQDYIKDPDRRFVADTVAAIGLCAQKLPSVASTALEGLLALMIHESSISSSNAYVEAGVLTQTVLSIKAILKQQPTNREKVIVRLARSLDIVKEPAARSMIIWIVGEYSSIGQIVPKIVPNVMKYLAWSFASEELDTKLQILNTAAKVSICACGEDILMFRKILSYIIELAKFDTNYDIRDRARFVVKFLPHNLTSYEEKDISCLLQNGGKSQELFKHIFSSSIPVAKSSEKNFRIYLPGSLSQIVLHAAPGYGPLPKPCGMSDANNRTRSNNELDMDKNNSFQTDDLDTSSGSSIEESGSVYESEHSNMSLNGERSETESDINTPLTAKPGSRDAKENPIVLVSDSTANCDPLSSTDEGNLSAIISTDLSELMSKSALESWLDEHPGVVPVQTSEKLGSGRITINNINCKIIPKLNTLLDPANGNGLRVEFSFSSETSSISPSMIFVEVFLENTSSEPLVKITLQDEESNLLQATSDQTRDEPESLIRTDDLPLSVLPFEEIVFLNPGQRVKKVIQVHFHHHLLPLKLAVFCNEKKHLTKLWPDIGYFLRSLSMTMKAFKDMERQLPGMFEYAKRCIFRDHIEELAAKDHGSFANDKIFLVSQSIASKVLSNSNLFLVSADIPVSFNVDDATGLCLRFSGELLNSLKPCLLTFTADGKFLEPLDVTVKINCEDTVFGLNLLNRVATFLQ